MKMPGVVLLLLLSGGCWSQGTFTIKVVGGKAAEPLSGASVQLSPTGRGSVTDTLGRVTFRNLPGGNYQLTVSYVGYEGVRRAVHLPTADTLLVLLMEAEDEDNPDIIISTTRTDRSVRNTPTRVEVIAGGEITESASMRPGEIRMLLSETTGLITQPTSAISNTANIRIQELDGRYTQVLRDGFPLYSGLSEGLSLVQIAPLDLAQVEIIKGSASTLYGGGAIAGLINLVSKKPTEAGELGFVANATSADGIDASAFYGKRKGKRGLTLFASRNSGAAYDPSGSGLTAIPKFSRYTFTPRFFLYGKKTEAAFSASYITENRLGGSVDYIRHGTAGYFENNLSDRVTAQADVSHRTQTNALLRLRTSYNHFNRRIATPQAVFEGLQQSTFSEVSYAAGNDKSQWVGGVNLYTDDFKERPRSSGVLRSYNDLTSGAFIQNTWRAFANVSIESGLRADYTSPYGVALLPRLSVLVPLSASVTSRISGGAGYKLPDFFTEESEEDQYQNIRPLNKQTLRPERSVGANADVTLKATLGELKLTVNPLVFYTRINRPLQLAPVGASRQFSNAAGYTDSKGLDLSFRLAADELKFFTGYSYTIAQNHFSGGTTIYPLAPKHKLHFDLVYELEGKLRIAAEAYYTGTQTLPGGGTGRRYWLLGALLEKTWKHLSVFINGEDLNDARQTRWGPIYSGPVTNPVFKAVYTPLEGATVNGGIKLKW